MLPLYALTADAPQATALAEAARTVEAAREALREDAKPSAEQLVNLRFALEKALKTRSAALGRFHPGTLEAAGLWGAALHRIGETERGDRVWVRACTELQRGLKQQERFHGAESRQLLGHLEALEACFQAQGLNAWPFSERLLSIAIATSKKPSSDLERGALAALRHAYGEFLSMRGTDVPKTLKWSEALAELWLRRSAAPDQGRAFLETALRNDAQGVWKLAATRGSDALKSKAAALLDRVDVEDLARERGWAGTWAHPLLSTPWKDLALAVLARVDRHLAAKPGLEAKLRRVDLAEAEGAWERGAELLGETLGTVPDEGFRAVAERALDFLERRPRGPGQLEIPALLEALTRAVMARRGALGAGEGELARGLALALEADGRWTEAEALRRQYLRGDDPSDRTWLARMLAKQGRFDEAAAIFSSLVALGPEQAPNLGFEWAAALNATGEGKEEARLRALEALERWSRDSLPVPRIGLVHALDCAAKDPQASPLLAQAMRKLRKEFNLGEDWPDLSTASIRHALSVSESVWESGPPPRAEVFLPEEPKASKETRAIVLLVMSSAPDARDPDRDLEEALELLDEAWEPRDLRLVPFLKRCAELQKDRAPTRAEAALRKALTVLEANREPNPADLLEVRTLLGLNLLQQGREEDGEKVLLDAFDRGAAGFHATKEEMDVAGTLVLALLQSAEAGLRYDQALHLAQRAAAVLEPLAEVPDDARRDLEKLLKKLERQAKLQLLLGTAWPG